MTITITAVEQTDVLDVPPSQLVTVTVTNTAPNAVPPNTAVTLWRIHADGTEHRVMVASQPRVSPTVAVRVDYHCPYNVPVTYRVNIGAASATVAAWLSCDLPWLIHSTDPLLSVCPDAIRTIADRTEDSRAVEMTPIGGKSVFKSDGMGDGITGSFTVRSTDEQPYRDLFADDSVFLINTPAPWPIPWMWVQRRQITWGAFTAKLDTPFLLTTVAFKESADPDLDLSAPWTCGLMATTMAAEGITCGTLSTIYASCLDLALDRRI